MCCRVTRVESTVFCLLEWFAIGLLGNLKVFHCMELGGTGKSRDASHASLCVDSPSHHTRLLLHVTWCLWRHWWGFAFGGGAAKERERCDRLSAIIVEIVTAFKCPSRSPRSHAVRFVRISRVVFGRHVSQRSSTRADCMRALLAVNC